jgi:N-terminal domain of (some) glycogen debranching enzymes
VDGNVTALSARGGDMGSLVGGRWSATGAQGIYVDDRRTVGVLTVRLGQEFPVPVADASSGGRSDFIASARRLGNQGADPTVEVRRRRTVTVQGVDEVVDVISRADQPVRTDVVLRVGGDGAPISSVKSGADAGPLLAAAPFATGLSWRDEWHRTDVTFDPPPTVLVAGGPGEVSVATFRLVVAPGRTGSIVARVRVSRLCESSFDADAGSAQVD